MEIKLDKINTAEALRYLGYGGEKPDANISELIKICSDEIMVKSRPAAVYSVYDINSCPLEMKGQDIKKHLDGCSKVVLFAATLGSDIDKAIRITQITDMAKAVVFDALASAAIEQVCNNSEKQIAAAFPSMYMTWRFSAGYGDFPIETQKSFIALTNAPKLIGLSATSSFMLSPAKSVTAVIGLSEKPLKKGTRGCTTCNMKATCNFRIKGEYCGF